MSSTTISSKPSFGSRSHFPSCHCGELAVLRTAMTSRNVGKKFWGCPNYKNGEDEEIGCNYFEWAANEVDGSDLLISKLKRKNQNMQTWNKLSKIGVLLVGTCGRDVPLETQFMLIESKDSKDQQQNFPTVYTILLPLLEGQFCVVLHGNDKNEIEICLESGELLGVSYVKLWYWIQIKFLKFGKMLGVIYT
ncbi:hypothetical protein Fmac_016474 [Flemingia macrophylla]|uniref:GRF-type domain-containing protein n=1 Tax=Flemingia macrophylla TaxID=520843 RepID=A0ABD1MHH0_9FABA